MSYKLFQGSDGARVRECEVDVDQVDLFTFFEVEHVERNSLDDRVGHL